MTTEMTSKLLNQFFEETYMLMENILENPVYCERMANGKYSNFMSAVDYFTSNIKVGDAWSKEEDDDSYFEAGYHDSNAVYYPFNKNKKPEKDVIIHETGKWINLLESVILDIKDANFCLQALDIKNRLSNLVSKI